MATRPTTTCPRCQRAFEAGQGKGVDGSYCSWGCAKAEQQRLARQSGRACQHCGEPVAAWKSPDAIYCGRKCAVAAANRRRRTGRPAGVNVQHDTQARRLAVRERSDSTTYQIQVPGLDGAACASSRFPARFWTGPASEAEQEAAKHVCNSCPCREPCLQLGVRHPAMLGGILGGLASAERARQRKAADGQMA